MQEFSPDQIYQTILRRWWVVVLCVLAGGTAGLLFHSLRLPLYEAEAALVVSLDFPPNEYLSQYEEDYTFGLAAAQISPLSMASSVVEALSAQGYSITTEEFVRQASLERKQSAWLLHVRHADPELASQAAQVWASLGFEKLVAARDHAAQAALLSEQVRFLLSCSSYALISRHEADARLPAEFLGVCDFDSVARIRNLLSSTADQFRQELVLSRGVAARLALDLPAEEDVLVYRVAFDRNLLALAGALLGFLASIWLVNFLPVARGRRV